jgi:hypothetical protein
MNELSDKAYSLAALSERQISKCEMLTLRAPSPTLIEMRQRFHSVMILQVVPPRSLKPLGVL